MRVIKGIAAAVLAATAVLVPMHSAQAAPPYMGYDYTDPAQTGCSATAITYWWKNLVNPATGAVNGVVELRYSQSCQTNWVRINNYVNGATAQKTIVRPRVDAPEGGSLPYAQDTTSDTYYGWSYGLQFYAPAWVCVYVGGVITLDGQQIATSGQSPDLVC